MSSTSKTPAHSIFAALAAGLFALALPTAQGQTDPLDSHISSIKTQFQQLDASAQACIEDADNACADFLTNLDTELPGYLQRCEALLAWREQVVTNNQDGISSDDTSLAQRLIDVEYTCGEDALIKRTNAVQAAFEKVRNPALGKLPPLVAGASNSQAARELQRNRNTTQQNVEGQRLRLQGEIERQWQRIQLENLREQNRQPKNYNDFDL